MANQICDLQAELKLVNPAATLTLSEMVSKLVSKLRDPKFQMLRFQISEWEDKRLAAVSLSTGFDAVFASAVTSSTASVSSTLSGSGGGGARSSEVPTIRFDYRP